MSVSVPSKFKGLGIAMRSSSRDQGKRICGWQDAILVGAGHLNTIAGADYVGKLSMPSDAGERVWWCGPLAMLGQLCEASSLKRAARTRQHCGHSNFRIKSVDMDDFGSRKILWIREIRTGHGDHQAILCESANYQELRIGDVFTKCYHTTSPALEGFLRSNACPATADSIDVELTITAIEWPKGSASDLLPIGHTGAIQFIGEGADSIISGSYLET